MAPFAVEKNVDKQREVILKLHKLNCSIYCTGIIISQPPPAAIAVSSRATGMCLKCPVTLVNTLRTMNFSSKLCIGVESDLL